MKRDSNRYSYNVIIHCFRGKSFRRANSTPWLKTKGISWLNNIKYSGRVALDILDAIYEKSKPSNRLDRKYKIYKAFSKEMKT